MKVRVEGGSRIHLGFYNIVNESRAYGSVGIYLEEPKTIIEVSDKGEVPREEKWIADRICGNSSEFGVNLISYPYRHVGLGSTTQISMSTALGMSVYCHRKFSYKELAIITERGLVSGIGIHAFRFGGLIIDGGRKKIDGKILPPSHASELPPLLSRLSIPRQWLIILVIPRGGRRRREEEEDFMFSPIPPSFDQGILYKNLIMIMHGATNGDLSLFSRGVENIQNKMGEYFAEFQGGRYSSEETRESVEILKSLGVKGVGQSSWGPLAYGFTLWNEKDRLEMEIKEKLKRERIEADVIFTKARNRGASVYLEK